ncbi:hypothetical protein J7337_013737 [Fusarium musae]|uniref:Uncharacterized protein n=1 Tax=Fusarium musae TaxID=1042133 RepID=A0A9P8IJR0_9HYPO|nr:hypothetical protein J7337_013737 [Fusarium musae]KAG9495488.1 hypothetical protein J7337_013737 [Fusarium musae]
MEQISEEMSQTSEDMSLFVHVCEENSQVSEELSQTPEETMHELKKQLMQSQLDSLRISMENLAHSFDRVPAAIIARSCLAILKSMISLSYSNDEKDDQPDFNQDRKDSLLLYAASVMPVSWYLRTHNDPSGLFIDQAKTIRMCCLDELKHQYGNSLMESSDDDDIEAPYDRMLEEMEAWRKKRLRVPVTDDVVSVALRTYKDCRDLELPVPQGLAIYALSPLDTGEEWSVQEV